MPRLSPDRLLHHADLNLPQVIGRKPCKIIIQQIRKSFFPNLRDALSLRADFFVNRTVHRKLGHIRQSLLICPIVQLFHQIQSKSVSVKVPGKCPLLHRVIERHPGRPGEGYSIQLDVLTVVTADRPVQVPDSIFYLILIFVKIFLLQVFLFLHAASPVIFVTVQYLSSS